MKYNWIKIQQVYDDGNSFRDLQKLYGMSSRTLAMAQRRGDLKTRSKSEAAKIEIKKRTTPRRHTEEFKERQRRRIIARYEQGWMPKAGRCKKYSHSSPVAGNVSLDGTWELVVAQWLDLKGYNWRRNTKRFQYTNLKGGVSYYTPDFWIEGIGYVEVKGYKTKLDECKWSQFPENLTVWFRKDVDRIKEELGG